MKALVAAMALSASLGLIAPARAQQMMQGAPVEQGGMVAAMQRMDRGMSSAPMTGDPDRDFTAMMIPHHQGAIDMARLYLKDGRDPEMRRLAEGVVADQEREIAVMKAWQAEHPAP